MEGRAQGQYMQTDAQGYYPWRTDHNTPQTPQQQSRNQQPDGYENDHPQHTVPCPSPRGQSLPLAADQTPADIVRPQALTYPLSACPQASSYEPPPSHIPKNYPPQYLAPGASNGDQTFSGVRITHPAQGTPTSNPYQAQTGEDSFARAATLDGNQHLEEQPLRVPDIDILEDQRRKQAALWAKRTDEALRAQARELATRAAPPRQRGSVEDGWANGSPALSMRPSPAYITSGHPPRQEDSYLGPGSIYYDRRYNGYHHTLPPPRSDRTSAVQPGEDEIETPRGLRNTERLSLDYTLQGQRTQPPQVQRGSASGPPDAPPTHVEDATEQVTDFQGESRQESQVSCSVPTGEGTEPGNLPRSRLPPLREQFPDFFGPVHNSTALDQTMLVDPNETSNGEESDVSSKSPPSLGQAASAGEINQGTGMKGQDLQQIARDVQKIPSSTNMNNILQSPETEESEESRESKEAEESDKCDESEEAQEPAGYEERVAISWQTRDMGMARDGASRTARDISISAGGLLNGSDDSDAHKSAESEVTPGSSQQGRPGKRGRGSSSSVGSEDGQRAGPRIRIAADLDHGHLEGELEKSIPDDNRLDGFDMSFQARTHLQLGSFGGRESLGDKMKKVEMLGG